MLRLISTVNPSAPAAVLGALLASLTLFACGGSTSNSSGHARTSLAGGSSAGSSGKTRSSELACLQKHGVPPSANSRSGGRPARTSGAPPRKRLTGTEVGGALKQCGGAKAASIPRDGPSASAHHGAGPSQAHRDASANFSRCMRAHGENVTSPNHSSSGPIIDRRGLDKRSAAVKTALTHCLRILRGTAPQHASLLP